MELQAYINEIKLKLTGDVLDLELSDTQLATIVNAGMRELQRYYDNTKYITVAYSSCINLSEYSVNAVANVYRSEGLGFTSTSDTSSGLSTSTSWSDPMYFSAWQSLAGGGTYYGINNWVYSLSAWNTTMQVFNTLSTDLAFRFDRDSDNLYVNVGINTPTKLTIEYVPRLNNVNEIKSDYWIDMLMKLCVALTKTTVGRIRSRYTQAGALWTQDGETLLTEGNTELTELRTQMKHDTTLFYPVD